MKLSQKYWLYFLIGFSTLHIIRDIFQDLRINNILSEMLVKQNQSVAYHTFWSYLNSYVIAIIAIILGIICLHKNKFGVIGNSTIILAIITFFAWLFAWSYL